MEQAQVKSFKDLNIPLVTTPGTGYIGDKISVPKILGKQITIYKCKITASKYPNSGNGLCLWIQIELNGVQRVIFTSSIGLQLTCKSIPEDAFPFTTTIILEENDSYKFT